MTGLLLTDVMPIAIGAGCALAALSLIYGIFKKSSEMSWTCWEILVLFALSFVLDAVRGSGWLVFLCAAGGFFVVTLLLHSLESFLKGKLRESASPGVRMLDRVFGAVTALVWLGVFVLAVGGLALCVLSDCIGMEIALFQMPIWRDFLAKHILDLSLIALLIGAYKGGFRLGLLKAIWTVAGIAATGGVFVGAFLMATKVGFLANFSGTVAGALKGVGEGVAAIAGTLIVTLICFVVLFSVLALVFSLVNWAVKRLNRHKLFNAVDGIVLAVILFAVTVLMISGAHYGVYTLAQGGLSLPNGLGEQLSEYFVRLGEMFASSPLSRIFYEYNPLRLLLG